MTLEVVQEKLTVGKGCDADRSLQDLLYRTELSTKAPSRLPGRYLGMPEEETHRRIAAARAELGSRLAILGHHYQRDEIIQYADFRGDSFKLARSAAAHPEADYIIFCGVHFMAESADVLSGPHQKVILPNLSAGCSMADMAPTEDVFACWDQLQAIEGVADAVTPVTYMNSTAALKAFCGVNGGVVCTSSNAGAVVEWALAQSPKVLFFPDQHLGRNTAVKMGYSPGDTVVWDPFQPLGGNNEEALREATFILWRGHCSVHKRFTVEQIEDARKNFPNINVIVHPECEPKWPRSPTTSARRSASSETVAGAPAGTSWAVGTEINLVNRLATEHPDKTIFCLDPRHLPPVRRCTASTLLISPG